VADRAPMLGVPAHGQRRWLGGEVMNVTATRSRGTTCSAPRATRPSRSGLSRAAWSCHQGSAYRQHTGKSLHKQAAATELLRCRNIGHAVTKKPALCPSAAKHTTTNVVSYAKAAPAVTNANVTPAQVYQVLGAECDGLFRRVRSLATTPQRPGR
jgi:hypothetical protein